MHSTNKEIGFIKSMALMGASDNEISYASKKVCITINRHRKNYFSKSKKKVYKFVNLSSKLHEFLMKMAGMYKEKKKSMQELKYKALI